MLKNRSFFGYAEDRHPDHLDAAISELGQFGEPLLHIRHGIMRIEIGLAGKNLVKDKVAGFGTVLL